MTNHNLARFDAAPYGVYRWAGEVAPRRNAGGQHPGDDGTGAVAQPRSGRFVLDSGTENTQDQEHRMSDETTPQDDAAMSPASAGSVDRPKPSAYLAMASGYDFDVFMKQSDAEEWLSHKDTNWKRTAPLYVWFDWEQMREARQRMAVKEAHMYQAAILELQKEAEMLRLTEKERNAIESAAKLRLAVGPDCQATLRRLLERMK